MTINGGLGTDTVEFTGDYLVLSSNLTVNAEHIKVDPGVTVNVGTGDITFNAVYKDNGISLLGITTTIPVLGVDGLVDISPDKGDWDPGDDYDAGDVVLDAGTATSTEPPSTSRAAVRRRTRPGAGRSLARRQLIGKTISLTAFAGTLSTSARTAQTLTGGGDTLKVASVAGFDDSGSFSLDISGTPTTCTYTGRDIDSTNHTDFKFTGVNRLQRIGPRRRGGQEGHHRERQRHAGSTTPASTSSTTPTSTSTATRTSPRPATSRSPARSTSPPAARRRRGPTRATSTRRRATRRATSSPTRTASDTPRQRTSSPSTTHPKDDTGLLDAWTEAKSKNASVAATFVLALGKSQLSGTSWITTSAGDVAISSNVKTNVTTNADASAAGLGAGIAVAVFVTDSEAYIDSTAATPVTAKNLTVAADTDNAAPTKGTASPKGDESGGATPRPTARRATAPTRP